MQKKSVDDIVRFRRIDFRMFSNQNLYTPLPNLNFLINHGTNKNRVYVISFNACVVVVNYEALHLKQDCLVVNIIKS